MVTRPSNGGDREVAALESCMWALLPLGLAERKRLLEYLEQRLQAAPVPPEPPPFRRVELWYPGVPGNPLGIEVDLVHVRAARSIRVCYDFRRDGFTITAQADTGDAEFDAETEGNTPWLEVAFVPAWHDDEAPQ
jgi:hypothetical protein